MSGDETGSDEDDLCRITDDNDQSLITDISDSLLNLLPTNRRRRQQEKLRRELVQEHIENQDRAQSLLKTVAKKLSKPL